jgi:4-amino-4-deoxy-L-arabinose transferase-like glycosyltransferase
MHRYELPALLGLALAVRLLLLVAWTPPIVADAADYDRLARSLAEGRGYTNARGEATSWRPPLYPAFVATIYRVAGGSVEAVRLAQVLVDAGTVALGYQLGTVLFGTLAGRIAGLLIAVNVSTISASSRLLSETLFTMLLMVAVVLTLEWWRAVRSDRRSAAVPLGAAVGAVVGAGTLCRGVLLLYPLCLIGMAVLRGWVRPSPEARSTSAARTSGWGLLVASGALLLGFALVVMPWTVRNYRVHGTLVPVATQVGVALYSAYNPPNGWIFGMDTQDETVAAARRLSEVDASAMLTRAAVDSILSSPRRTLRLEVLKAVYFWVPVDWEILPVYGAVNPTYLFVGLWALGYAGLRLARRWSGRRADEMPTWPAWLPIAYLFVMAMVVQGTPRYRLPCEPLLAVFAAAALAAVGREVSRRTMVALVSGTLGGVAVAQVLAGPLKSLAKSWISGGA